MNKRSRIKDQNEKQEKAKKKKMEASKKELEPFLLRSMRDKKFWASDFCVPLRKWAQFFTANPLKFPIPLNDSPRFDATEPDPSLVTRPKLDENFIQSLVEITFDNSKGDIEPVLQIVKCETGFEDCGFGQSVKRARILLWDGGTKVILGVPVTNLYFDVKAQLSTGNPIIKLKRYNEVTYVDKGSSARLHGIVVQFLNCQK